MPQTPPTPLANVKRALLLGAAGSGMRGLGYLLSKSGIHIIGADLALPTNTNDTDPDLQTYEWISDEEASDYATKVDIVIRSDAVPLKHPAVAAAIAAGVRSCLYSQAVGELLHEYTSVAVAGTHGKTTTTAMLAHILITAGLDPTVLIGARMPAWGDRNARVGKGSIFIIEADEYRNHFLDLRPSHAIITNIDFDHPDFFLSITEVEHSFQMFLNNLPAGGAVVTTPATLADHQIRWPAHTMSAAETTDIHLYGQHMRSNAALAMRMAVELGVTSAAALKALNTYPGVGRRLEQLGTIGEATIFSDYGHHPAEIASTLSAIVEQHPTKKIAVIFEAHTGERLTAFSQQFAAALAGANAILLAPPFLPPGRSKAQKDDAQQLLQRMVSDFEQQQINCTMLEQYSDLATTLKTLSEGFPLIIAFSAGILDGHLRALLQTS